MTDGKAASRWKSERTTFQRVYDVLVGTDTFLSVQAFADHARCSETAARKSLEQLTEMGIADRRDGRPASYRRNESYFRWKRVEALTQDHSAAELRDRLSDLIEQDEAFQEKYGVPDPDAVSTRDHPVDDHEAVEKQWADLADWRTVRRDIVVLRRAVDRTSTQSGDGAHA